MNIVEGRGKNRTVVSLPHGSVFAAAAKSEPDNYRSIMGKLTERVLRYPASITK